MLAASSMFSQPFSDITHCNGRKGNMRTLNFKVLASGNYNNDYFLDFEVFDCFFEISNVFVTRSMFSQSFSDMTHCNGRRKNMRILNFNVLAFDNNKNNYFVDFCVFDWFWKTSNVFVANSMFHNRFLI